MTARRLAELVDRLPETVSRWAVRGAEMRQESEELSEEYERLDRALAASQQEHERQWGHERQDRWAWHLSSAAKLETGSPRQHDSVLARLLARVQRTVCVTEAFLEARTAVH